MKRFVVACIACLLLVALILPACAPAEPEGKTIKIGIIGPMQFTQGEGHWWGAEMARDEINDAGGITVAGEQYLIELIKADSNEILSTTDAAAAMERLITVDNADFVMGGFRTEAVFPMQEVAMDYQTIFLDCGAATKELCTVVAEDYDRYKYFFRVTPICNVHLVSNTLMSVGMAGGIMKQQTGIQRPLRVAICAEGAQWADAMVGAMEALIPAALGMEVSGTWRPSPTATELTAEMTAIEAANTDIIMPIISGPLGIPYARTWGELEIPAASVGINVESQKDGFWEATAGYGNYETTLNTYCEGVALSDTTVAFIDAFKAKTGQTPTYTAGTYEALRLLRDAIERAGTLESDAVVLELEKTDVTGTAGRLVFTGQDTDAPHDVTYGPGYVTGITTQWQGEEMKCVWPNLMTGDWEGVKYDGTVMWVAPPRVIAKLEAEAATEPPPEEAAPEEAAPEEGALSFKATEYTNDEYGFSIQYPADWGKRPELVTGSAVAAFGVLAFIPGVVVSIYDTDEPLSADWYVAELNEAGNKKGKALSDLTETTLADGTPATELKMGFVSGATGSDIVAHVLFTDKDDKRFCISVFTVEMYVPYDEALFSEIAHTLTFE